jgi:lipoyl(octanoyl) transferase
MQNKSNSRIDKRMLKISSKITMSNIESFTSILLPKLDKEINFVWLGRQHYQPIWDLQKILHKARINNEITNTVLFVEHEHVYTLGKNANESNLLSTRPNDAEVIKVDRGGDVTYHGLGQLVGYLIVDIRDFGFGVSDFVYAIENSIITALHNYNIKAEIVDGFPGVWVSGKKITAIGIRLSKWISMHGFALNIYPDMKYFSGMVPCGIQDAKVTSVFKETKIKYSLSDSTHFVLEAIQNHFIRKENV